jgi:alkylation response protein AidB-like acyl-CoA dehydrogenase
MVRTGPVRAALEIEPLLQRARDLKPILKERAMETEGLRRLPDENVRALLESGLNRIAVPVRFGGLDVDFSLMHDVAFELGRACGATAWCYSLWGVHNWWVGYYPPEAQEEIYAEGPDVLISTAVFSLHSQAEPVDGGYRLSGRWQFSSGCDHARWAILHATTASGPLGMLVPVQDFEIQQDTWFVSGMQGTGSKDVVVHDVFVPMHRTLQAQAGMRVPAGDAAWTPREYHRQRRYSVPFVALIVWDLVAPAIGIAQGAIDEFSARLAGTSGKPRAADSPLVQVRVAESAAEVDAARAILHADIEEAQWMGENGQPIVQLELARWNRDKAYAMKLAVQATGRLFELAGGHALYTTDPLQRMYRDVQAAAHRDGLVFDFGAQQFGRAFLGIS